MRDLAQTQIPEQLLFDAPRFRRSSTGLVTMSHFAGASTQMQS